MDWDDPRPCGCRTPVVCDTADGEWWREVLEAAKQVLVVQDQELAFGKFSELETLLEALAETGEFGKFCQMFPYEDFIKYAIGNDGVVGRMALLCLRVCLCWQELDFRRFESMDVLEFFMRKLNSADEDEVDIGVQFLCNMCLTSAAVPEFLVEQGIFEQLQTYLCDSHVAKIVCALCSCRHKYLTKCLLFMSGLFSCTEADVVMLALTAWFQAYQMESDARPLLTQILLEHLDSLLENEDVKVMKELLIALGQVEGIDKRYFQPLCVIMNTLSPTCPKIIDLVCRIMRRQWVQWKELDTKELCQFLLTRCSNQRYDIMRSCLITLVQYFRPPYGMNEDLINLLMDHADDPSLSCLLLHGVCRSLEYLKLKKVDVTSVIDDSKKTAVKELLDADSPEACQLAAMVLEMLNHG